MRFPPPTPEKLSTRGTLARFTKLYGANDPRTQQARQRFEAEKYLAAVRAAAAGAPKTLTDDQRARLAAALRPVVALVKGDTTGVAA